MSRKKIRAVHLLHTIVYGGVETSLLNWIKKVRSLPDPPIEISLVCFENPGHTEQAFLEAVAKENIPVQTIPWSRRKPVFSSGKKLAHILKAERADVLHTHNTYADLTGLVAARLTGVKTVSSVYVWSDFGWKRNALQWINQWALRYFDGVAAQCRTTMQDTCARGIDPRKLWIAPSGFEVNRSRLAAAERTSLRESYGAGESDIVLANVARLYPEKAQARLLRVFKEILAVEPRARLWILGVGPLEQELRRLARELDIDAQVRFFGFCQEVGRVLKLADIQVHPSHAEGVPLAVLDGMSCGLPLIASNVGGIPEILQHGVAGLLVPSASHPDFDREFTGAVLKLAGDPGLRNTMAANAAEFIETEYSMEAAVRKLEQMYREVLTS